MTNNVVYDMIVSFCLRVRVPWYLYDTDSGDDDDVSEWYFV